MYGKHILSVVMTGMGSDGAKGTKLIKQAAHSNSYCLVQSFETCVVPSMPQSTAQACPIDGVVPLIEIADVINRVCLQAYRV
jgi:two-component system chemotaxis response regulator CheB